MTGQLYKNGRKTVLKNVKETRKNGVKAGFKVVLKGYLARYEHLERLGTTAATRSRPFKPTLPSVPSFSSLYSDFGHKREKKRLVNFA